MNLRQGIAAVVVAIAFGCESVGPAGITEPEAQLPLPPPVDPVLPLGLSDLSEACRTGWVEFPDQPVTIWGGSENGVYHRRYEVALPSEAQLVRVASFIGVDAGDLVEADIEIESVRDGARIYQRSLHKDGSAAYDAWDQRWVSYQCGSGECRIRIVLLGRCTGRNGSDQNANYGKLKSRIHFGLRMMLCKVS